MNLRFIVPALALAAAVTAAGQTFSLDSCRAIALRNNKQLRIASENVTKAGYQRREARAAYFPAIDFNGGYVYNQKNISLLSKSDYLQPLSQASLAGIAQKYPHLGQALQGVMTNPQTAPLVGEAMGIANDFIDLTNNTLRKSTSFDVHNVFFGAVSLAQPIYMGGKIVAMNRLTGYATELAEALRDNEAENIIYSVDAAYWTVVSLKAKQELATSYVALLDSLDRNVRLMEEQGVATRADRLSVDVKLNSANVDLTKVDNGLVLTRMALAQICGLPIDSDMHLTDEPGPGVKLELASVADATATISNESLKQAYNLRPDLRALQKGIDIAGQQKRVALSDMLPKVALIGAYTFSNPNMFNGFSKKFGGAFSVGATVSIPIWHWGGNYYKYKAAEADQTIMNLKMEDAREMVDLQVNQAAFKARESIKTYKTTQSNLESANENLRCATVGFREGVITTDDVLAAQTAWLKANSENIDAMIDVRLCDVYLRKVLGTLAY